jgi:hypothetical protein
MEKNLHFAESIGDVVENLEAIELNLVQCSDDKMFTLQQDFSNQISDLLEETHSISTWHELADIIAKAKLLELDIASWLARHGKTSLSLPWPKIPTPPQ